MEWTITFKLTQKQKSLLWKRESCERNYEYVLKRANRKMD